MYYIHPISTSISFNPIIYQAFLYNALPRHGGILPSSAPPKNGVIATVINGKDKSVNYPAIAMHQWTTVEVSQSKMENGDYVVYVEINGNKHVHGNPVTG